MCAIIPYLLGQVAVAQQSAQEAPIKAAILYNLVRFSDWPAGSFSIESDPITLCTCTTNGMRAALSDLDGKSLKDHALSVIHLAPEDRENVDQCNILFISEDSVPTDVNFDILNSNNILTIGDSPALLTRGIGMSIHRQGKKIRFAINRDAVTLAGIKPSSKILHLAVDP